MAAVTAAMVKELRERTGLGMLECKKALKSAGGDINTAIEELRKSSGMKAAKKASRVAADGVVSMKVGGGYGILLEINSETDFAARDENFLGFVEKVASKAMSEKQTDVSAIMSGDLENARESLVQKIGENINVRRLAGINADIIDGYKHSNNKIAVLVGLKGGTGELAKDVAMHIAAVNPQFVKVDDVPESIVTKEKEILTAQALQSGKPPEIIEKMIGGRIKKFLSEISLTEQPFVKDPDIKVGKMVSDAGAEIQSFLRYEVGEGIEKKEVDFAAEVAAQLKDQE